MKNLTLFIGFLVVLFSGCSSCKDKDYPTINITDQRLIDGATIKKGSYFVYQDSATNVMDSVWVINFNVYYQLLNNANCQTVWYSSRNTTGQGVTVTAGGNYPDRISGYFAYNGEVFDRLVFVKLPFITGESFSSYLGDNYVCMNFYAAITVAARSYTNVYELQSNNVNGDSVHSYYSLENGLVRFITSSVRGRHTWNLVNSHIIR